jgi:hypothetical protein
VSLSRISSLGFWEGLLGSFFVFWVLIASTVGALVVMGIRVRRMERSGRLSRWGTEMRTTRDRRKDGGVEEENDGFP